MDSTLKLWFLLSQILFESISSSLFATGSDYNTFVYKNCSSKMFTHSTESHSKTLSSLFNELLPQSSKSKFFKATAGDDNGAVSGLFQCRGDLSNDDCYGCVNSLPELSNTFCYKAAAGRIQLHGCYFHYETDDFTIDESSKYEALNKICGEKGAALGFQELRDEALAAMESGVIEGGKGFYSGEYQYVHATAQCEGDLGACECDECVSSAVQIAREECGDSISGQIYLDSCFISYSYNPNGALGNSKKGSGNDTGKKLAIVLGGVAALGFGFMFMRFLKSFRKKDDIW